MVRKAAQAQRKPPSGPSHVSGLAALAKHAGKKDTIRFDEEVRVGTHRFFKGMVAKFEDPALAAYFDVCFNGTEFTTAEPNVTISSEEMNFDEDMPGWTVDPHTVIGNGRKGVEPGVTVFQHLTGGRGSGDGALQVHDSGAGASSEV